MAAQGFTDQGISNALGIGVGTVGTYWGRVRIKLGAMSRTELVAVYLKEKSQDAVEELTHRISELLVEIEDHIQTEQVTAAGREFFRGLLDTAPDAIIVVFSSGCIHLANKEAERMFGYECGELVGLEVEELVPARSSAAHVTSRRLYNEDPSMRRVGEHMTTFAMRKDKSEFQWPWL